MSTFPLRLLAVLSRRRPSLTRLRQRCWALRLLANCLIHVAARRLARAARRLSAIRRFCTSPDSFTVVLLVRRPPRFAIRIRCVTLDPQIFESPLR